VQRPTQWAGRFRLALYGLKKRLLLKRDLDFLDSAQDTQWIHIQKSILEESTASQVDGFKNGHR